MWKRSSIALALLLMDLSCHSGLLNAAEVKSWQNEGDLLRSCSIEGTIESHRDTLALVVAANEGCRILHLDSPGGNINIAMELGTVARGNLMHVVIDADSSCSSSCVLVFAGGIMRLPYGLVRIHRPYLDSGAPSFEVTQQQMSALRTRAIRYLREMNVSEALWDRMLQVGPEYAEPLSLKEMTTLGLGLWDPVYVETRENNRARDLRMTKRAFLQKKLETARKCGRIDVPISNEESDTVSGCWKIEFPGYFGE